MDIGLQVSNFTWGTDGDDVPAIGSTFARIARDADHAGMSSLWVMDHFFQIEMIGPPEHAMLEGYSALAFAAAITEKIKLGTMVTGVTYRHPGLLVKTVTTLDVLSGGRAWLGIGAAWNEEEHRGLGVPYPSMKERFERLEETLQIAHRMWEGDESPIHGTHYQLERPLNSPQSLSRPHVPILVGGTGEKKTLRFVAQYADACNIFAMGPEPVAAKYDVIRRHCEDVGRDYADIHKTVLAQLDVEHQSTEQILDLLGTYAAIGTDEMIVGIRTVQDPAAWETVPQIVAAAKEIAVAGR